MQSVRLYCLPYAGGNAAIYRDWPSRLPSWIQMKAMHLPGRGARYGAEPIHEWDTLVGGLAGDVDVDDLRPMALFGHSMGALLAFELAFELRRRHGPPPVWLGVSGCGAPGLRDQCSHWLDRSDEDVIAEMRRLKGTPETLLGQREWLDLVLPCVRADFHLCGTYCYRQRSPLASAISVFVGADDELTHPPESREGWRGETRNRFAVLDFAGDHFFIHSRQDEVIAAVADELRRAVVCLEPSALGEAGQGRCMAR